MDYIYPVITVDGPSGSGKGTLSQNLARILGWNLLDSGVVYRTLALLALKNSIDIDDEKKLADLVHFIKIDFIKNKNNRFFALFHGKEIDNYIFTEIIGNIASKIAIFPKVRNHLLKYLRTFRIFPGLVADGRDMGTVVFPNAICKIFLQANFLERKERRLCQLWKNNSNCDLNSLILTIKERDRRDYNRILAPLVPAIDSLILDSTYLSANEVYYKIYMYIIKNVELPSRIKYNLIHNQGW